MTEKRALVLSGGGSRGAYQVGALRHILRERRIQYDIITGISVGALNGSLLAMYNRESEVEASVALSALWDKVDQDFVYRKWWFRELAALWRPSVYNSKPLHKQVDERIDADRIRNSDKEFSVGAVSLTTGRYHTWNDQHERIVDAVKASSAFPGMFLPVEIEGEQWVDGGIREIAPVKDAIDMGATHIDVLLTHPQTLGGYDMRRGVLSMLPRIIETSIMETTANDLEQVELYNELISVGKGKGKRHIEMRVLEPEKVLIENALDFDPERIMTNRALGYRDAKRVEW